MRELSEALESLEADEYCADRERLLLKQDQAIADIWTILELPPHELLVQEYNDGQPRVDCGSIVTAPEWPSEANVPFETARTIL